MNVEDQEQDYIDFYSNVLSDKRYESLAQMNYSQLTEELNRVHQMLAPSTDLEKKQVAAFKRRMRKEWRQLCKQTAREDPMGSDPVISEVETPLSAAGVTPLVEAAAAAEAEEQVPVIDLTEEPAPCEQEEELPIKQEEEEEEEEDDDCLELWAEQVPDNLILTGLINQYLLGLATGTLVGVGLGLFIAICLLVLSGGVRATP